jgi:hypothetical protein
MCTADILSSSKEIKLLKKNCVDFNDYTDRWVKLLWILKYIFSIMKILSFNSKLMLAFDNRLFKFHHSISFKVLLSSSCVHIAIVCTLNYVQEQRN